MIRTPQFLGLLVGLLVASAACTSFDDIDRDVCGNGLVEQGEDCDSNDPSCVRCAVVCNAAEDCPSTDYTCGIDGLCHAPSGVLAPAISAGAFQVNDYRITDVDGDRIGDAIGTSRTSLVVRHGDPGARMTEVDSLITPSQTGPAAFADLDNDGSLDVTITTPDGLVAYTSPFGPLAPLAVQSSLTENGGTIDLRSMFRVGPTALAAFAHDPTSGSIILFMLDVAGNGAEVFEVPCRLRIGAVAEAVFSTGKVDVYQVTPEDARGLDAVISFTTEAPRRLCVLSVHRENIPLIGAAPPIEITDVTPLNGQGTTQKPVLADLDGDGDECPGLVNTDNGAGALRYWDGAMINNRCSLRVSTSATGDALPVNSDARAQSRVIGRIPLVPRILAVANDALVTEDAVFAYSPGFSTWGLAFQSSRKLASVDTGDLNGDGTIDAVLVPQTEDDLDVLLRTETFIPGYQPIRIDTASRVTLAEVADFDGNRIDDIAFVEQLTAFQRLFVSYGTVDRLLDPTEVGSLTSATSLTWLKFPDSVDILALTAELFVLQSPPPGETAPTLTLMAGSPQRTLIPYFDPRGLAEAGPDHLLRGAIAGHFADSPGTAYRDVISVNIDQATGAPRRAYLMPGTARGPEGAGSEGVMISGVEQCRPTSTSFCIDDAAYLAWSLGDARDSMIAVDRATTPHAMTLDPRSAGGGSITAVAQPALASKIPQGTAVRSLYQVDLEGDGSDELVVALTPRPGSPAQGGLLVCTVDTGIPTACEDLLPQVIEAASAQVPISQCIDAAPAGIAPADRLTPGAAGRALIVLCRGEGSALLRVARRDGSLDVGVLARTSTSLGELQVGDVNGDGLDDAAALEGESGARSLVVFPQCSSRDAAVCRGGGS